MIQWDVVFNYVSKHIDLNQVTMCLYSLLAIWWKVPFNLISVMYCVQFTFYWKISNFISCTVCLFGNYANRTINLLTTDVLFCGCTWWLSCHFLSRPFGLVCCHGFCCGRVVVSYPQFNKNVKTWWNKTWTNRPKRGKLKHTVYWQGQRFAQRQILFIYSSKLWWVLVFLHYHKEQSSSKRRVCYCFKTI